MLCIKKNKCFSTVLLLSQKKNRQHTVIRSDLLKHVWTCRNTFQSVQTCWNLSKHVSIRSDLSRPVSRLPPLPLLPPSPPSSPFSPFFGGGGGREGEGGGGRGGNTLTQNPPEGGGGGRSPPPPLRILTPTTTKNKILSLFLLQNLCNLPLPPRGFSQSTAAAQNYINTYGGGLSTKKTKFIVAYWNDMKFKSPPKYYYYYYYLKKKKISSLCGRCPMMI